MIVDNEDKHNEDQSKATDATAMAALSPNTPAPILNEFVSGGLVGRLFSDGTAAVVVHLRPSRSHSTRLSIPIARGIPMSVMTRRFWFSDSNQAS